MDVPPILSQVTPPQPSAPRGKPKRHGCLVTWMILMVILEVVSIVSENAGSSPSVPPAFAGFTSFAPPPGWYSLGVQVLAVVDIVSLVFLFLRKKMGFFGSAGAAVGVLILSIIAGRPIDGASALLLPAVLFGVLQIGGENSGWKQLK